MILLIAFSGCGLFNEKYTFKTRLNEIQSIEVVELGVFDQESLKFFETSLSEPLDVEVLKEELLALDCGDNWGDPQELCEGDIVFKIKYNNGDFDLVGWRAQLKHRSGRYSNGYMVFNESEFMQLIGKYTNTLRYDE